MHDSHARPLVRNISIALYKLGELLAALRAKGSDMCNRLRLGLEQCFGKHDVIEMLLD